MYIFDKTLSNWEVLSHISNSGDTIEVKLLGLNTPEFFGGSAITFSILSGTTTVSGTTINITTTNDYIKFNIPASKLTTKQLNYLQEGEGIITITTNLGRIKDKFKIV